MTAFSWQKALGGEAAHGMIILGPRAIEQLKNYTPSWPVPFLLRLKQNDQIALGMFEGMTLNTPSMLCIEDFILALNWAEELGGLLALVKKARDNQQIVSDWTATRDWVAIAAEKHEISSHTTVCLKITADWFRDLDREGQWDFIDAMCLALRQEGAAFDVNNHRFDAPSLRIWCGPTIEAEDVEALLPWLDWAFERVKGMRK